MVTNVPTKSDLQSNEIKIFGAHNIHLLFEYYEDRDKKAIVIFSCKWITYACVNLGAVYVIFHVLSEDVSLGPHRLIKGRGEG